ncbi:glycosyltransferase [Terrabacter sp. NPDC080008]|uniref:glycosyltransferase n=1 Tax=Terrabacter sp. NPDC080008 TaxID=3155176 RepID=UPI00344F4683
MREVSVGPVALDRFAQVLPRERVDHLREVALRTAQALSGHTVWNVSSTERGGGVAEMLQVLVGYGRGAGVDTRWFVIDGDDRFFAVTKRLHNLLHGFPGDRDHLDPADEEHYLEVLARNLDGWQGRVRPGDVVLLHDPQTAGMARALRERGAHVIWRCHIGSDRADACTARGWEFLRPFLEQVNACVFSRKEYAPTWLTAQVVVIAPSLDPFSAKNAPMTPASIRGALDRAGIIARADGDGNLAFVRRDGTAGMVRAHHGLLLDEEGPLPPDADVLLQVSRWDHLKDMAGVLTAVASHLDLFPDDVHLLLVGPDVRGVTDDPEGAQVLEECRQLRPALPSATRARVHLCCLPMDDVDENAHLVNALQRHAGVVAQKSLMEGFGLTVTEPMWKHRPLVASAVGGIVDQIEDGVSGVLLHDPRDLDRFAVLAAELLADPDRRSRMGAAAHERVLHHFLGDRHLMQYGELFTSLVAG